MLCPPPRHVILSAVLFAAFSLTACHSAQNNTTSHDTDSSTPQGETRDNANVKPAIEKELTDYLKPDDSMKDMGQASKEDAQTIREVYQQFKNAVLGYHGKEAAAMMSDASLKYYALHLELARLAIHHSEEYKVIEEDLTATIHATISLMKERLSSEFIDSATPQQLYETAFSQGWIGYHTLSTASIDNIHVYDNQGVHYYTGDFYYAGTLKDNRVMRIGFIFENNAWKVDLMPIFIDLDQTVERYFFKTRADRESSVESSIKDTNSALAPQNWKPSVHKNDAFAVNFPRAPLYAETDLEHIYTSQDYRYGQFDVRIKYYPESDNESPYYQKAARDLDIMTFLKPLGAENQTCSIHQISQDTMIKCDFQIPSHESRAKAIWLFTTDRRYLLFNLARNDQYSDEAAAIFMKSFSYGTTQIP